MKLASLVAASLLAATTAARSVYVPRPQKQKPVSFDAFEQDRFLIELEPGKTAWVSEEQKWELKRVSLPL